MKSSCACMHLFMHACMHAPSSCMKFHALHACMYPLHACMHPLRACMKHACKSANLHACIMHAVHACLMHDSCMHCMHDACMQCMHAQFRRVCPYLQCFAVCKTRSRHVRNNPVLSQLLCHLVFPFSPLFFLCLSFA